MMRRYLITTVLALFSVSINAQELPSTAGELVLAKANVNIYDIESIKRGAKFFANTCMSCHTLKYLRYDKLANEAGITLDKMPLNVKTWPYGVTPPDLSLEADVRGPDWIYTYLHSFYQDSARPTGANNLVLPNTAMPDIVAPYQGTQEFVKDATPDLWHQVQWYDMVELVKKGNMSPEEFDATISDLVNFLSYAAQPYRAEQETLGYWVLGFLAVLFVLMYMLKKEYWKDVKKPKDK